MDHLAKSVGCLTLFSTHYHMLTNEVSDNGLIALRHMSCYLDEHRYTTT